MSTLHSPIPTPMNIISFYGGEGLQIHTERQTTSHSLLVNFWVFFEYSLQPQQVLFSLSDNA